eukprot:TRINITY_DN10069_c0_g2_i1.p2 TRINITY_DN10069_c0_g2~~TRINITY_DN10069_c0_g2_i1.p2  ORF type:complete len:111 (+),score=6.44 TRINITY_DN10069_c0_g2_i1:102-434(+)
MCCICSPSKLQQEGLAQFKTTDGYYIYWNLNLKTVKNPSGIPISSVNNSNTIFIWQGKILMRDFKKLNLRVVLFSDATMSFDVQLLWRLGSLNVQTQLTQRYLNVEQQQQ